MLWEELTFSNLENRTEDSKFGDCTQEECKIECDNKCGHLCEIFFSCAEGRKEDLGRTHHCTGHCTLHTAHCTDISSVADFETRRLRELTQSLTAVINVLEAAPLMISTGQKDLLDCMQCFSFRFRQIERETLLTIS